MHIGKYSIGRAVRYVTDEMKPGMRYARDLLELFHGDGEGFLTRSFEDAESTAVRSGRITLMQKDVCFVKYLWMRRRVFPGVHS